MHLHVGMKDSAEDAGSARMVHDIEFIAPRSSALQNSSLPLHSLITPHSLPPLFAPHGLLTLTLPSINFQWHQDCCLRLESLPHPDTLSPPHPPNKMGKSPLQSPTLTPPLPNTLSLTSSLSPHAATRRRNRGTTPGLPHTCTCTNQCTALRDQSQNPSPMWPALSRKVTKPPSSPARFPMNSEPILFSSGETKQRKWLNMLRPPPARLVVVL